MKNRLYIYILLEKYEIHHWISKTFKQYLKSNHLETYLWYSVDFMWCEQLSNCDQSKSLSDKWMYKCQIKKMFDAIKNVIQVETAEINKRLKLCNIHQNISI